MDVLIIVDYIYKINNQIGGERRRRLQAKEVATGHTLSQEGAYAELKARSQAPLLCSASIMGEIQSL